MIWNTENENSSKRYTSTVGPAVFTITEAGEAFVLNVVLTVNGSAIELYTDRCETIEKCLTYSPAKARGFLPKPLPQECHALPAWSYRA